MSVISVKYPLTNASSTNSSMQPLQVSMLENSRKAFITHN